MNFADLLKIGGDVEGVLGKALPVVESLATALTAHGASISASAPDLTANTDATKAMTEAMLNVAAALTVNTAAVGELTAILKAVQSK